MNFIEFDIEYIVNRLDQLNPNQQPNWGTMSAQRMVEHLTDSVQLSTQKISFPMEVPEEKIGRMQDFLRTDKPLVRNVAVAFAPKDAPLRNEEMELAIDELVIELIEFEEFYSTNPSRTATHPYYGALNYELWVQLHKKHFTHHFEQFNLVS
jgi:hypothetical protein